jgi:hypothetical protein
MERTGKKSSGKPVLGIIFALSQLCIAAGVAMVISSHHIFRENAAVVTASNKKEDIPLNRERYNILYVNESGYKYSVPAIKVRNN